MNKCSFKHALYDIKISHQDTMIDYAVRIHTLRNFLLKEKFVTFRLTIYPFTLVVALYFLLRGPLSQLRSLGSKAICDIVKNEMTLMIIYPSGLDGYNVAFSPRAQKYT